jgi:hypothetical protein
LQANADSYVLNIRNKIGLCLGFRGKGLNGGLPLNPAFCGEVMQCNLTAQAFHTAISRVLGVFRMSRIYGISRRNVQEQVKQDRQGMGKGERGTRMLIFHHDNFAYT